MDNYDFDRREDSASPILWIVFGVVVLVMLLVVQPL